MKKENIVTRKWGDRRRGKTDWARVDALTDEDIAGPSPTIPMRRRSISTGRTVLDPREEKAISIRVDEDVLDFFKKEGDGYQRRINAVLRSYMQQKQSRKNA